MIELTCRSCGTVIQVQTERVIEEDGHVWVFDSSVVCRYCYSVYKSGMYLGRVSGTEYIGK